MSDTESRSESTTGEGVRGNRLLLPGAAPCVGQRDRLKAYARVAQSVRAAANREADTVKAALDSASGRDAMARMEQTIKATAPTGKR